MECLPNANNSPSTKFAYEVVLKRGCKIFEAEPFSSQIKNLGELIIKSNGFEEYQSCAEDCMNLIASLSATLKQVTDKRYVIASKINPIHDELAAETDDKSGWSDRDVIKMFLADAKVLREDNLLKWEVCGTVSVQHTHGVDLKSAPANQPVII